MAIKLSANYSKKLGLPQYSSHSFSASVEVELTDITQVQAEVQQLYALLQHAVDQEIQHPGFVPQAADHNNGQSNGNGPTNGNGRIYQLKNERWNCTVGQQSFIQRILHDNKLDKDEAENLSQMLFHTGVKQLNKMQASQLIEDLLVKAGKPARQNRWQSQHQSSQAA
jgi:hypothetical protein